MQTENLVIEVALQKIEKVLEAFDKAEVEYIMREVLINNEIQIAIEVAGDNPGSTKPHINYFI